MDPNARRLKAPPLPKFQEQASAPSQINEKVASFLSEIEQESSTPVSIESKPAPADKKKLSMASLSSKLNSIIGGKKIDLNKVVVNKKPEQPKERREIEIEYDPANPNSYEQARSHYTDLFNRLADPVPHNRQEEEDEQISALLARYEVEGNEMEDESTTQANDIPMMGEKERNALKIMQKFGYKVGDGLGKKSQGIRTPLTIKKLTDSICIIEPSTVPLTSFITRQQIVENALSAFKVTLSTVIVLVLPIQLTELTEEIEYEIKGQCEKQGKIEQWVAFSLKESIRFFCRFGSIEEAFTAFLNINGRYYDQKVLWVYFYPSKSLENKNLAQPLHLTVDI